MKTNILTMIEQAEVVWKPLGEVCSMITTGKLNANAMEDDGIYPFFTCNENPYRINEYAFDMEAILISGNGSQVGHINYYSGKFNAYQRTYVLGQFISEINIIYLVHYFRFCLKEYILVNSKKGSVPYITLPMLQNFQIPIPPLELQKEIVKRLDILTELEATLEATLEAELSLRKKQYQYYRDFLLSESELAKVGFEWKRLGEVVKFTNGKGHEKDIVETGQYIVVNSKFISSNGIVVKYSDKQICPLSINDVLIVMSDLPNGKALAKTFIVTENDRYTLNQRIGCLSVKDTDYLLPKYLNFFLNRNRQLLKYDNGVDQTNLKKDHILSVQIPIPKYAIQAQIVAILDKFDRLTSSITDGLPKEIELRRKQYEYYRELLLGFASV